MCNMKIRLDLSLQIDSVINLVERPVSGLVNQRKFRQYGEDYGKQNYTQNLL